jgi:hypothetical protein
MSTGVESMSKMYQNYSPELVAERGKALADCDTKSGRSEIYRVYYLKMKEKYEKNEKAEDDDDDDEVEDDEGEDEDEDDEGEDEDEDDEDEDDEDEDEEDDEDEDDEDEDDEGEDDYVKDPDYVAEEEEVYEDEEEEKPLNLKGKKECEHCLEEWQNGYISGWTEAMKYIAKKTNKRRIPSIRSLQNE